MEVVNNLLNYNNLKIVQNTDWFSFSLDSVLLANFVKINKKTKNIIDFCTGNAPVPLILSQKTTANIIGVELQKEVYELAKKSVEINGLDNRINLLNINIKNLIDMYETDMFDVITCNPPYFKVEKESQINKNMIKSIARHELEIDLDSIFSLAKKLLKNNGSIYMVHRTSRLVEIIESMKKNNIQPKKIQFVFPKIEMESNIVLIEGTKNGNAGLKVLKPLYIHDEYGNYLDEVSQMFQYGGNYESKKL